jgi:hypothetical protein
MRSQDALFDPMGRDGSRRLLSKCMMYDVVSNDISMFAR